MKKSGQVGNTVNYFINIYFGLPFIHEQCEISSITPKNPTRALPDGTLQSSFCLEV